MTTSVKQQELIKELESIHQLNSRFENLHCVNLTGQTRRGVMSLVFQAYDNIENSHVAIKVMDPEMLSDPYRLAAFEREAELLETIEGKKRCLQLKSEFQKYDWELDYPGLPGPFVLPCGYFVTEWIEEDIDDYFFHQDTFSPESKLLIFRNILLAVSALHRAQISHRDLKIDNIRVKSTGVKQVVVIIDLGTSARSDSPPLASAYNQPVGARGFAPPEAFVGFSGDRKIGYLADTYALGSLLFDLFNIREFLYVLYSETEFHNLKCALGVALHMESTREGKLRIWREKMKELHTLTIPPVIDGPGHSVPPSIAILIRRIYFQLINFDFNNRMHDLSIAVDHVDSALNVLKNKRRQAEELQRRRNIRQRRQEKTRIRQERLNSYLTMKQLQNA